MANKTYYTEYVDKETNTYIFFKIENDSNKLTTVMIKEEPNTIHFTYMVDKKNTEKLRDDGYEFIIQRALTANDSNQSRFLKGLNQLKKRINSIK